MNTNRTTIALALICLMGCTEEASEASETGTEETSDGCDSTQLSECVADVDAEADDCIDTACGGDFDTDCERNACYAECNASRADEGLGCALGLDCDTGNWSCEKACHEESQACLSDAVPACSTAAVMVCVSATIDCVSSCND